MEIIYFLAGVVVGGIAGIYLLRKAYQQELNLLKTQLDAVKLREKQATTCLLGLQELEKRSEALEDRKIDLDAYLKAG